MEKDYKGIKIQTTEWTPEECESCETGLSSLCAVCIEIWYHEGKYPLPEFGTFSVVN